jgi:hypothetical protein
LSVQVDSDSSLPITRSSATVGNSQYLDHRWQVTVNDQEWKSPQDKLANVAFSQRPALRRLCDHFRGAADFVQESRGYSFISRYVPIECRFEFGSRSMMKFQRLSHGGTAWQ